MYVAFLLFYGISNASLTLDQVEMAQVEIVVGTYM